MAVPRYAIYFAPDPSSALWQAGSRWLGRDAIDGMRYPPPDVPGLTPPRVAQITEAPRRYGFHATLKAPFALAEGRSLESLLAEVDRFAAREARIALGRLRVAELGGFLALVLAPDAIAQVQAFAQRVVEAFDPWRLPLDDAERARRGADRLDARGRELLERWGYPLTEERFTFHVTLTRALSAGERTAVEPVVRSALGEALAAPVKLDAIAVFEERDAEREFHLMHRAALTRTGADASPSFGSG